MHDPRNSLRIVSSEQELEQAVRELAQFLGYNEIHWYKDIQYDTLIFRFSVNKDQLTCSEQVVIPARIFFEKSKLPMYHLMWLEIASKLKGIKHAE